MSKIELKPCPFCGNAPVFCSVTDMTDNFDHGYTIACNTCGIEMGDEYKSDVADAWNTRAATPTDIASGEIGGRE